MKNILIIGLLFTLFFFPVCVEAKSATIYVVPAITDDKILPASSIPSSYISDTIFIKASPGEFEPASFVIHANEEISPITIKITDLTGSDCIISNTSVDIRTVKCWYQGGYDHYDVEPQGRYLTPELLLKDDSLIKVTGENWTKADISNPKGENYLKLSSGLYTTISNSTPQYSDLLVTPISKLPVRDSTTLQPVTVPKGYNKQFWVILKVPFNASSGNYSGKIIIESNTRIIQELKLNLQVLPIELSKTNMEYSLFYRGKITENGSISSEEKTTAQFTAEIQNMYDHGITNPTIYPYIGSYGLFQTHETAMCKELSIRQNIGLDNTRLYFCGYVLPDTIKHFKDLFAQYGVVDIYQYGPDEQDINITESRDYITSVHNSGGKYFVAEWIKSYAESVPDVLDLVIAGNIWPDVVDSYHSYGHKIFLYNCPQTVPEYPHTFRLNYGLLLWQKNYDGTMDYAYQHSFGDIWNDFDSPICRDHVFAYPTMDGVIDTIQWEGFREGVDDVRYLTTLQNKIALAKSEGKNTSEAENYLANLKNSSLSSMDLDEVRGQIIYYTLSLQNDLNSTNQNTSGNDSTNENNYTNLTILQKPIADFWESPKSGNVPLNVTFTDNSTGSPTAWNWNFGDGTINSTLQNPVHTYSTAGDYTVVFTASNAAGSSTVTGLIRVTPPEDSISDGSAASKLKVFDNRLREASPDTVFQSSPYIDIGGMNSVRYRDMVWFNLSEYTGSANVNNATLSLYWYYPAGISRPSDTVIEVYRPASSWNPGYVSWNKRDRGIAWKNPGGDWYDKKGVLQGSTPYATLTIKGSALPDNRYYELNVTDLVKEYVSGKYENTGFLIKARTERNNYIAFYSSDCGNENQIPKIRLVYS